jgi:hypothetical protein
VPVNRGNRLEQRWWRRRARWVKRRDVVDAFRIVGYEIRGRLRRLAQNPLTQGDACEVAMRIRDQRELLRQLVDRRDDRHVRRLLAINRRYRRRLIALVAAAGLDTQVLLFK